ncbi:MAG: PAS domain S-box protein [Caldilineae bacterium]|nr:MAG: PAS domain S-box protein [Caldilineae bacterium]
MSDDALSKEEQQTLSQIVEQTTDSVVVTDVEGTILYVNPAFERATGYRKEEVLGKTPRILKSGEHPPEFYARLWETLLAGKTFQGIFINRRKDGQLYYEERIITPLKGEKGEILCFIATGRNLTEHHHIRRDLLRSRRRLDEVQRVARIGYWQWDIPEDTLYWSDEVYRIFGVSRQQVTLSYQKFLQFIHPGDRENVRQKVEAAIALKKPYEVIHRIIWPDGAVRSVHERGEVIFDRQDRPIRMVGTVQDITERRQLEEQLNAIYYLGQELILLRNEADVIRRVLETVNRFIPAEFIACGLVNKATNMLEYRYILLDDRLETCDIRLSLDESNRKGIGVAAVRSGEVIYVPDVSCDGRYVSLPDFPAAASELCVPIVVRGEAMGVLNVESSEGNHFTQAHGQMLRMLADQVAIALEGVHLYDEIKQYAQELSTLNVLIGAMTSELRVDAVLSQVLEGVKRMLKVQGVSILVYDSAGQNLTFAAAAGPGAEEIIGQPVPLEGSIAGRALQQQETIQIADARQSPHFYDRIDALTGLKTTSLLAVPLIFRDKVIGVLEAINKAAGRFTLHEQDLLEMLARSAALAIDRARLFEAERRQREMAETLGEMAQSSTPA